MERTRIAVLCADLGDVYNKAIVGGAVSASEEFDIDLVMVPGKYYRASFDDYDFKSEYQYNALYSYINKHNVDALIILMGALGPFSDNPADRNYLKRFTDKYLGMPVVSVSAKVEGWSCIKYDNFTAIKEGIHYMVEKQGCKKIAMVTGEKTSEDALERLNAYKEALLECDMDIDESLIVYGDFSDRTKKLIRKFLATHPGIDAMVFANDAMAKCGYEVMDELGLKVGKDIAFLGFDDIGDAVKLNPPLATVKADPAEMGYEAVKLALKSCQMKVQREVIFPTRLMMRESITRTPYSTKFGEIFSEELIASQIDFRAKFDEIFEYLFDKRNSRIDIESAYIAFAPLCDAAATLYSMQTICEEDFLPFEKTFFDFIEIGYKNELDATKLMRIFDAFMESIRNNVDDVASKAAVSYASSKVLRRIVEQQDNRSIKIAEDKNELYHISNMITKSMFNFERGTEQNYATILSSLFMLGISHSFLVLLEQPVINLVADDFAAPKYVYFKAVQNEYEVTVPVKSKQKVSVDKIFEHCTELAGGERMDLVMLDLFSDDEQYGVLICDIPYYYDEFIEQIMFQVSNAIQMLRLLRSENAVQEQLESSLALLKKHNIELDNLSKKDELTGIYNRRGFYNMAREALKKKPFKGKMLLVAYADTDNLKIINDRYGHDEGDYAITSCSQVLTKVFNKDSIIGRIGGDEFVIVSVVDNVSADSDYKKLIEAELNQLNENPDKAYYVRMSVGMVVVMNKTDVDIKDLLERADAVLYKEKKHRRKEISKQEVEKIDN